MPNVSKIEVDEIGGATGTTLTLTTGHVITGSTGQFQISGGTAGQALTTDGTGNLTFSDAGASVTIADDPPSSPSTGDLWWESDTGILKVYYNDGTTSQWVDATPQDAPTDVPSQTGQAGKYLQTDGTNLSWATVTHPDQTMGGDLTGTASNAQIAAGAVDTAEIATDAVTANEIAADAVDTAELANYAVTSAKILDGTIVDADINASAAIAGTKVGDKVGLPHRNVVINGQFDVWQRGTNIDIPGVAANMYYCDMWRHEGYGFIGNVSRQTFTNGQTTVPDNPTYFARLIITTNNQGYQAFVQRIENYPVDRFSGRQVTVSVWLKSVSGTLADGTVRAYGKNSLDGSGTDNIGAITTSWQKYSWTGTHGTATNYLTTGLNISNGTLLTSGVDIANFQYEFGPTATTFEQKPYVQTLEDCQRYYSKSYNNTVAPGTASSSSGSQSSIAIYSSGSQHGPGVRFPTRMRTTPTVVIYSPGTGASGAAQNAANNVDISVTAGEIGEAGFQFITGSLPTGDTGMRYHWTADAGH